MNELESALAQAKKDSDNINYVLANLENSINNLKTAIEKISQYATSDGVGFGKSKLEFLLEQEEKLYKSIKEETLLDVKSTIDTYTTKIEEYKNTEPPTVPAKKTTPKTEPPKKEVKTSPPAASNTSMVDFL